MAGADGPAPAVHNGGTMVEWRVASETGTLHDVLLCAPDNYSWQATNAVAAHTLAAGEAFDLQRAQGQYRQMVDALEGAGVTCHYTVPEPQLPYQVYTRDSSQVTPWGPVITQLYRPVRRGEYASVIDFYTRSGGIWKFATAGTQEGGDIHMPAPGVMVIGCSGERTTRAGAEQICGWYAEHGWRTRIYAFPEHFLHLDVLFCMAAERLAVAAVDMLEPGFVSWLRDDLGLTLIPVDYRDTMALGCNILALGGDRVISPAHNTALNAALRAEGLTVLDPELDLFTRGGGGVRCMTMPLRRG